MTPENKNINGAGLEHFSSLIKAYVDSHGTQVPTITLMPQQVVSVEPPSFRLTDSQYNIMATTNFARIDCSNIGMEDILLMFERDAGSEYIFSHPSQAGIDGVYVDKTSKIATLVSLAFCIVGDIIIESEQFIDDDIFELTDEQKHQLIYSSYCNLDITYPDETYKNYIIFNSNSRFYGFNNKCLVEMKYNNDNNTYYIEEHPIGGGMPEVVITVDQVISPDPIQIQLTQEQYDTFMDNLQVIVNVSQLGLATCVWTKSSEYIYSHPSQAGIDCVYVDKTSKIATLESLLFSKTGDITVESEQFIDDYTFELTDEQEYQLYHSDYCNILITYPDGTNKSYLIFDSSSRFYGFNNKCLVEMKWSNGNYYIEEHPIGGGMPAPPSADGEYNLHCSIVNGVLTYTWKVEGGV